MNEDTGPFPVRWQSNTSEGLWKAICLECPAATNPCKHIRDFFQHRYDLFHGPLPDNSTLIVPIFFSSQSKDTTSGRSVEVDLLMADDYGNIPFVFADTFGTGNDEVIDVISPSSGVWAIRNSLLQYLYSMYRTIAPCGDSRHPRSQMFSKEDTRVRDAKSSIVLNNIIDLLSTGKCSYCLALDDQSQFIPDI